MRFQVFTAVKFEFFWIVTPCSVVVKYQRFGGHCHFHHPEDGGNMDL
jgi:hypothetical protein